MGDEYHVGWAKIGYPLVSSFTGVNGRFISVQSTTSVVSGLDFDRFNRMYYLYASLLEEYVMSLTGSNSTCAVSEVFKGLLNGKEFYYYYDSENLCTVLKLADNSSWLEFSDFGYISSIINREDLQNKYNGGMCLGNFNYNNVGFQLIGELVDLLNLRSSLSVIRTLCNQLYETIKDLPGGEVIAPYAANLILGLFGSDVFWYGIGIVSVATFVEFSPGEILLGAGISTFGGTLVAISNGLLDKSYSNTETFVFSLLDLGTAGLLGKGIDAVCKFGLSGGYKSVYEGIHVFLLSSINESIKEISKFYQNI